MDQARKVGLHESESHLTAKSNAQAPPAQLAMPHSPHIIGNPITIATSVIAFPVIAIPDTIATYVIATAIDCTAPFCTYFFGNVRHLPQPRPQLP
jgi:hypothetical protein